MSILLTMLSLLRAGKNRPLDDDELDFVNDVLDKQRHNDQQVAQEELDQLEAYRQVVAFAWDKISA